jgi:hypothetical protein
MANALIEDGVGRDPAPTRLHLPHRLEAFARSPPLERAVASMPRCAAGAVRRDVKAGARLMLAKPWRIQGALFGGRLGPLPGRVDDLLACAGRRLLHEEAAGLAGHWTYSFNRHLAVRQSLLALRFLRRARVTDLDGLW